MRTLKIICVFFGLWSATLFVRGAREIYIAEGGTVAVKHAMLNAIWSLFLLAFWGSAIYGIQKKALIAWRFGWVAIAVGLLTFLAGALPAIARIPKTDYPWAAAAAVILGGTAVALYGGFWWKKQRSYFVKPTPSADTRR